MKPTNKLHLLPVTRSMLVRDSGLLCQDPNCSGMQMLHQRSRLDSFINYAIPHNVVSTGNTCVRAHDCVCVCVYTHIILMRNAEKSRAKPGLGGGIGHSEIRFTSLQMEYSTT